MQHRVKKGLAMLVAQGTVTNPVYGYYRLIDETEAAAEEIDLDVDPQATELDDVDDGADSELAIEMEEGDGDQVVYAFYLPVYRRAAEQAGLDRWPMKIGMTTRDLSIRLAALGTALPEVPAVLIFRTDNAPVLEKVFHNILTLRGRRHRSGF